MNPGVETALIWAPAAVAIVAIACWTIYKVLTSP